MFDRDKFRAPEPVFLPTAAPIITPLTRPCEVDGQACRFHRFVEEDRLLLKVNSYTRPKEADVYRRRAYEEGIVDTCCSTEILRETRALIEWPDGSLATVALERVTFTDRKEG
jgi:hypothetical protein